MIASQSKYAEPRSFMISSKEGMANNTAESPAPDDATRSARAVAIPKMSGRLRRYPNRAPDAVASDVAPPGDPVDTSAKLINAMSWLSILCPRGLCWQGYMFSFAECSRRYSKGMFGDFEQYW